MIKRGFSAIALVRPKYADNVGGAMRAAHCYGCAYINLQGPREDALKHASNTPKAERHIPTFLVDNVLEHVPAQTKIVAVELLPGAEPLHTFKHPERALYVFGPEDGSLEKHHTECADHTVFVPTRNCMNLAACVNVVLYDRWAKGKREVIE